VFSRTPEPKGPMSAFGYDYLTDKLGAAREQSLRLPRFGGIRGGGGDYAYEALNLVDGRRTTGEIRDALSAIYGPVPLDMVAGYLLALEEIKVLRRAPGGSGAR
jgi:aminopeptidase YwaD